MRRSIAVGVVVGTVIAFLPISVAIAETRSASDCVRMFDADSNAYYRDKRDADVVARSFQDHASWRILKGRCMTRLASRLASVMSRRPVRWWAPTARLRRLAMTRGPDLVRTVELSSW